MISPSLASTTVHVVTSPLPVVSIISIILGFPSVVIWKHKQRRKLKCSWIAFSHFYFLLIKKKKNQVTLLSFNRKTEKYLAISLTFSEPITMHLSSWLISLPYFTELLFAKSNVYISMTGNNAFIPLFQTHFAVTIAQIQKDERCWTTCSYKLES